MRRLPILVVAATALTLAATAAAALEPVRRDFGELSIPRVRPAVELGIPAVRPAPRIRVLVRLRGAPLAAFEARRLESRGPLRRLDVRAPAARRHLQALAAEQDAAARRILAAIPAARVGRRLAVLVNALDVELPADSLGRLNAIAGVSRVYPSLRYTLATNRSPALIGASVFSNTTGARGDGIKIAVVDDGVDPGSSFFAADGFAYPVGFPRGQRRFTTPKVIVAKSFPAPGTPASSRLAFEREASFHGTHVAGIAAGNGETTAPRGPDHPQTTGLSGVAPRAWIGNYRVFSLPTPVGNVANTPEIVAAFEEAVKDGMDVINFSGGGPESDPARDAMIEVIANAALAGVPSVIAAGNDRDDFGDGSAGSPGTAPEAISVAAVSDTHVFGPTITVEGFDRPVPYELAGGVSPPESWATQPRELVDVTTITGTDGRPVDAQLCAPGRDPNADRSTLPLGSLRGTVALVSRGHCTFVSKADRALDAGAVGVVFVDNRAGEANEIPTELAVPGLQVADLDGADLRAFLAPRGGRAPLRASSAAVEVVTGRGGVVTSFSSPGPTAFGHALKPDVAAPGGHILSSTNPGLLGASFAVFDGTSMATPHVAGAIALLLDRHPGWTPAQVRSALVSTAGPAWADTGRTTEAPVTRGGAGLIDLGRADDPRIFTRPSSLSFGDLVVTADAAERTELVALDDAGGGAGEWAVSVRPQTSTPGAALEAGPTVTVPGTLRVTARAPAGGEPGVDQGFVVLERDGVERRIPYLFVVSRPGLAGEPTRPLRGIQTGTTRGGGSRASLYRWPATPFGHPPDYEAGPAMREDGAERLYRLRIGAGVVNFGVAVESSSADAMIDPFVLGGLDEWSVQGFTGTPVNVNGLTDFYRASNGAAGAVLPQAGMYIVSVDSGRDIFTGELLGGRYVLRSWIDDLRPPTASIETRRVAAGSPVLAARFLDAKSGVDPITLTASYGDVAVGAAFYDPVTGLAVFPIPDDEPLDPGRNRITLTASDHQESKNVQTVGTDVFPNTVERKVIVVVETSKAVVSWLEPAARACVRPGDQLVLLAGGPRRIRELRVYDGARLVGRDAKPDASLFSVRWKRAGTGLRKLRAVAVDDRGAETTAARMVRACR